jgi:hypothetical protein
MRVIHIVWPYAIRGRWMSGGATGSPAAGRGAACALRAMGIDHTAICAAHSYSASHALARRPVAISRHTASAAAGELVPELIPLR